MELPLANFITNHFPIFVAGEVVIVTQHNRRLFVNFNSMCHSIADAKVERWKRGKNATALLATLNAKARPGSAFYGSKNFGTWGSLELFEHYANWVGEKTDKPLLGTRIKRDLPSRFKDRYEQSDPFFQEFKVGGTRRFLRAKRTTGQINLTDITTVYEADIRNWKRTDAYKTLVGADPTCIDSSNQSVDEFGTRTSYGNTVAAKALLDWCGRKCAINKALNVIVLDFIKLHDPDEYEEIEFEEEEVEEEVEFEEEVEVARSALEEARARADAARGDLAVVDDELDATLVHWSTGRDRLAATALAGRPARARRATAHVDRSGRIAVRTGAPLEPMGALASRLPLRARPALHDRRRSPLPPL
jgi:hypothetical protein